MMQSEDWRHEARAARISRQEDGMLGYGKTWKTVRKEVIFVSVVDGVEQVRGWISDTATLLWQCFT